MPFSRSRPCPTLVRSHQPLQLSLSFIDKEATWQEILAEYNGQECHGTLLAGFLSPSTARFGTTLTPPIKPHDVWPRQHTVATDLVRHHFIVAAFLSGLRFITHDYYTIHTLYSTYLCTGLSTLGAEPFNNPGERDLVRARRV